MSLCIITPPSRPVDLILSSSQKFVSIFNNIFFLNGKFGALTDGPLEYHRATSESTRSYPSPLGIMHIYQFRGKPNKYRKTPLIRIEPKTY
ncbi:hypothetical protein Hanom_Chr06g00555141 [Helianthus anomalus]